MLRAALSKDQTTLRAWEKWKSIADIDRIDAGSYRLLPLVYTSLKRWDHSDSLMPTLKGIYRRTWYQNQMLFYRSVGVLRAFHDAGISTVVLKGAALAVLYYKDIGARPMNDFDILVPTERALTALDVLREIGLSPKKGPTDKLTPPNLYRIHGFGFINGNGLEIDLHWHVLKGSLDPNADVDFWESPGEINVSGIQTLALNPTDQLLHVCGDGERWDRVIPPIRWVADAMAVVNTSYADIDWDRLVEQVQKHRLRPSLSYTLRYLCERFDAPIPREVFDRLKRIPVTIMERIDYGHRMIRMESTYKLPLLASIRLHLSCYSRITDDLAFPNRLLGFPRYLQGVLRVKSVWLAPFYTIGKLVDKIRHDGVV